MTKQIFMAGRSDSLRDQEESPPVRVFDIELDQPKACDLQHQLNLGIKDVSEIEVHDDSVPFLALVDLRVSHFPVLDLRVAVVRELNRQHVRLAGWRPKS